MGYSEHVTVSKHKLSADEGRHGVQWGVQCRPAGHVIAEGARDQRGRTEQERATGRASPARGGDRTAARGGSGGGTAGEGGGQRGEGFLPVSNPPERCLQLITTQRPAAAGPRRIE